MTELATLQCFSTVEVQEPESIDATSEGFSPDILHVFQDEQNPSTTAMHPNSLTEVAHQNRHSSFPHFARLPVELRYLVWEAAVPDPAVIPRTWHSVFGYNLQRKVPSVLQVCSEARRLLIAPSKGSYAASSPKYQLVRHHGRSDGGVYLNWRAESMWIYRGCEKSFVA